MDFNKKMKQNTIVWIMALTCANAVVYFAGADKETTTTAMLMVTSVFVVMYFITNFLLKK